MKWNNEYNNNTSNEFMKNNDGSIYQLHIDTIKDWTGSEDT